MLHYGILLAAAMSFDEFIEGPAAVTADQLRQVKNKYSDFMCENSDLITIVNIIGGFMKGLNIKNMLSSGYKLEKQVEQNLNDYCEKWSINAKTFKEAINFIMQLLKLFEAAISEQRINSAIDNLIAYRQPTIKNQSSIIDSICKYSYTSVARCVEVYKSETEKVKRLETMDYRQARFFKSTFVKKTSLFYIYQTIIDIEG